MDDPNQIEVPPSFLALYSTPSGHRLTEPMSVVRDRYELCEDMAQMLTGQASLNQAQDPREQREVLVKTQAALKGPESPVQPAEAQWVARRLAELLAWDEARDS